MSYTEIKGQDGQLLGYNEAVYNPKKDSVEFKYVPPSKKSDAYKLAHKVRRAEQVGFVTYVAMLGLIADAGAIGATLGAQVVGELFNNPNLSNLAQNQAGPIEALAFLGLAGVGTLTGLAKWGIHRGMPFSKPFHLYRGSKQIAKEYKGTELAQVNPLVDLERARARWSVPSTIYTVASTVVAIAAGSVANVFGPVVGGAVFVGARALEAKFFHSRWQAFKESGQQLRRFGDMPKELRRN